VVAVGRETAHAPTASGPNKAAAVRAAIAVSAVVPVLAVPAARRFMLAPLLVWAPIW
jgi:hypothetical protein